MPEVHDLRTPDGRDAYEVLQVSRTADDESIRRQFLALTRRHHPDQGGDGEEIRHVTWAHDQVTRRRPAYDDDLASERPVTSGRPGPPDPTVFEDPWDAEDPSIGGAQPPWMATPSPSDSPPAPWSGGTIPAQPAAPGAVPPGVPVYPGHAPPYASGAGATYTQIPTSPLTMGPPPSTNLVWGILATLFCCLATGIVSIIYASQVGSRWSRGDAEGARRASGAALMWALLSPVAGIVSLILYISFIGSSASLSN